MVIKRLYRFMLRSFLPLFLMTFFICLFIVLMQFLWRYIDDLVGKGLEMHVIGELFFYAALTMVPMALPLAILLASLMTFGNLGERFELTAMKASGISLMKVMRPLIVFIALVAIGAFFFQNYVLPVAQAKMWTLLYSVRQKSPELEIPEGVFYDQIPGYNFYVEEKDRESGTLFDMMIYDVSRGFENARIILADSGHLKLADDKEHLFLQLHSGEQFENLRENSAGGNSQNQPYRRESFKLKEILLKFDANFNRMDESGMRNQYVGKNISQLRATIDSVTLRVDSIGAGYARDIKERDYMRVPYWRERVVDGNRVKMKQQPVAMEAPLDMDSLFYKEKPAMVASYLSQALLKAQRVKQDYEFKSYAMDADRETIRRHGIEMQKKFTLSFACLIFFFIGAPLGAIIRKGGLGTPLVISVILFIIYYIIDNTGYKMARDGKLEVWMGMWLSSAILLPLGVFFTYKAMKDSAVFDLDAYKNVVRRLTGKLKRELEVKEFTMQEVDPEVAVGLLGKLQEACNRLRDAYKGMGVFKRMYYLFRKFPVRDQAQAVLNDTVDYLSNSRRKDVIAAVNLYPFQLTVRNVGEAIRVNSQLITLLQQEK
ncbi:MAG: LptF/LptG family permease [Muribaculaceae bacterium]|nr:LptF/LptG family permease [Muribaculaceae bacterium]